jgi:hypothetical protein
MQTYKQQTTEPDKNKYRSAKTNSNVSADSCRSVTNVAACRIRFAQLSTRTTAAPICPPLYSQCQIISRACATRQLLCDYQLLCQCTADTP